ncbi:unnamed protein product [Cladocopium goreaui]|uniref:Uncharacterized protein n=1 Tax=Cladocopium goreaui TaxID=2562237 RepID=A0A9P1DRH7_9DINO|nr:unnamed protein product [Cladocopium goreaui]|mmetsp:Transcript_59138/g.129731  ORF Transcript_59138/g.129731 Transcript_59138/m.129731 type:complete len:139 (+) Transcript_59138:76-492(+)
MGQGLDVLRACYQREDRSASLCCGRRPWRPASAAGRLPPAVRQSWSPGLAHDDGLLERTGPVQHSTTLLGHHIDWPLSRAERLHLLIGLYQDEEKPANARAATIEDSDLQLLSDQIAHLSELVESSRREQMMMASCSM